MHTLYPSRTEFANGAVSWKTSTKQTRVIKKREIQSIKAAMYSVEPIEKALVNKLPWSAWGPKTASNLKVFLGAPFEITVSSPSLADSKSTAITDPAAVSSLFRGLHRQKTLMFPAKNIFISDKPHQFPIQFPSPNSISIHLTFQL